ncbi:unnamed protein product [Hymenolepis diminuta]|uniref:Uncharacterized protein n=1 Tax=Hymenolepis diminuta TaxID=6216 RepID=A0A0R3SIK5_HYMDI|nr:unnamed protein product [Hymenolepis diminuta]
MILIDCGLDSSAQCEAWVKSTDDFSPKVPGILAYSSSLSAVHPPEMAPKRSGPTELDSIEAEEQKEQLEANVHRSEQLEQQTKQYTFVESENSSVSADSMALSVGVVFVVASESIFILINDSDKSTDPHWTERLCDDRG